MDKENDLIQDSICQQNLGASLQELSPRSLILFLQLFSPLLISCLLLTSP